MSGNTTMCIFLAKNMLGYADNPVMLPDTKPFVISSPNGTQIVLGVKDA